MAVHMVHHEYILTDLISAPFCMKFLKIITIIDKANIMISINIQRKKILRHNLSQTSNQIQTFSCQEGFQGIEGTIFPEHVPKPTL